MRALAIAAIAVAGCVKPAAFECTTDSQCAHAGIAGTCEPIGACSFPDGTCASGQRYGSLARTYADQCVDPMDPGPDARTSHDAIADAGPDASIDAPVDAPPDAPRCPSSYAAIPNGGPHLYRVLATPEPWADQRAACRADGPTVQLAVPLDAPALLAIVTLAGTDAWIGISDASLEGTYVTVSGPATFLPWAPGEPDNTGNQDCVRALAGGTTIETDKCMVMSVAVCECVP